MVSEAGQSLLVGRLSPDRELARTAAFALFVRVYLQQVGLLPERLSPATTPDLLPAAIAEVASANPHAVAPFVSRGRREALAGLDGVAVRELLGWLLAQRVHQEEPQVAYELGMLALSVELPPIVVRGLREAEVHPHSRVAELPDGGDTPPSSSPPCTPGGRLRGDCASSSAAETPSCWPAGPCSCSPALSPRPQEVSSGSGRRACCP